MGAKEDEEVVGVTDTDDGNVGLADGALTSPAVVGLMLGMSLDDVGDALPVELFVDNREGVVEALKLFDGWLDTFSRFGLLVGIFVRVGGLVAIGVVLGTEIGAAEVSIVGDMDGRKLPAGV